MGSQMGAHICMYPSFSIVTTNHPVSQISTIVAISVTIAMYCLIQLYVPVRANLAPHKPLLKLFAIKAVGEPPDSTSLRNDLHQIIVFLTFWQATLLSLLGTFGVVKNVRLCQLLLSLPLTNATSST